MNKSSEIHHQSFTRPFKRHRYRFQRKRRKSSGKSTYQSLFNTHPISLLPKNGVDAQQSIFFGLKPLIRRFISGRVFSYFERQFEGIELRGFENVRNLKDHPIIYASNHTCKFDALVLASAIAQQCRQQPWFMGLDVSRNSSLRKALFLLLGVIPFQKHSSAGFQGWYQNYAPFARVLNNGESLIGYPEGTLPGHLFDPAMDIYHGGMPILRSDVNKETGCLTPGNALLRLALATAKRKKGKPQRNTLIVPVGMSGLDRAFPHGVRNFALPNVPSDPASKVTIKVHVGRHIDPKEYFPNCSKYGRFPSTKELSGFNREVLMPAISRLIDFENRTVPTAPPPLSDEDIERFRVYEREVFRGLQALGYCDLAKKIDKKITERNPSDAIHSNS